MRKYTSCLFSTIFIKKMIEYIVVTDNCLLVLMVIKKINRYSKVLSTIINLPFDSERAQTIHKIPAK